MSQLETQILHQDYLLTCPDGQEAQLLEAVERVDHQFQQMLDNTKLRSRERIGVLLAVNLAFESLELRNQLQALQQQLAALQGAQDADGAALTDVDAERLHALEAQASHDQALASALVDRIDQALAQASQPLAHAQPSMEATADAMPATADIGIDTDLDNAAQVELPSTPAESL